MQHSIKSLETYLRETLHAPVQLERWRQAATLPAYLTGQYDFFDGTVGDVHILFLHSAEEPVPSAAKKHERALQQKWTGPVAFVFERITPRIRQRMVSEGLSFVVPGNQVYLPALGVNLRERYQTRVQTTDRLRPSAQVLFLHVLANHSPASGTPSGLARRLGYTAMAMGQALNQLEDAKLVTVHKEGRERLFELAGEPADLWLQAQPLLASPVSRRHYVVGVAPTGHKGLAAGLSALATYSALAQPTVPVVALDRITTKGLLDARGVQELPTVDEADLEVEVWSYKPGTLSEGPAVDRLSLYLSLRDDTDERVHSALDEMMRGVTW
ncbi:MAG: helix-turn-helix domain-containing protein [Coriobacteriia bacterium]|nr:helix-turn-helix domain-containing protein [Coriobacteriia bacterium]